MTINIQKLMSKTNITLVLCIVIISTLSYAMELVPLKSQQKKKYFQIHCIQDIPKLSLKDIRPCFSILPERERNRLLATKNRNNVPLAESLTFNMAILQEGKLIHTILMFMMDSDEISTQLFYETPLWYAHTRYHFAKKMLKKTSLIKQPVAFLFRLFVYLDCRARIAVEQSLLSNFAKHRLYFAHICLKDLSIAIPSHLCRCMHFEH